MPTTERNGLPEFWVSHIAKSLVGEVTCLRQPWMLGHYRVEKRERTGDLTTWKTAHTAGVVALAEKLRAAGWTLKIENQNFIKFRGLTAYVSGKPDIIGRKAGAVRTWDYKGGKVAEAHVAQVAIYAILIPLYWKAPELRVDGCVSYADHDVPVHWEQAMELRPRFYELVRTLADAARPETLPSFNECRFCDITKADCPDRVDAESVDVLTSEF